MIARAILERIDDPGHPRDADVGNGMDVMVTEHGRCLPPGGQDTTLAPFELEPLLNSRFPGGSLQREAAETVLKHFRDVDQGISALLQSADLRNGCGDRERPWDEILQHVFLYFFERLA